MPEFDFSIVLSVGSLLMTGYFWLVQSRRERPNLQFFQLSHFRATSRRHPDDPTKQRFCLQQLEPGGVLVVNHSLRQNAIVVFDCYLLTPAGEIRGDWGYASSDKPPWNLPAESSLAISPAFFFDLPSGEETPTDPSVRVEFITASGRRFTHVFQQRAPRWFDNSEKPANPIRVAA
jgi:hypothetical protein